MDPLLDTLRAMARAVKANIDLIPSLSERAKEVQMGADGTPTAQIDKIAENTVLDYMARHGVSLNVLSEEIGYVDNGAEETLVLDPIDGSNNAIIQAPMYTVSMAVGSGSLSGMRLAYLYNPATGEEWWAEKGKGAFKDGARIRVRKASPDHLVMSVYMGRSSGPEAQTVARSAAMLRSFGCTSLEIALVAEGASDAYYLNTERYERGVRVVDVAAALLILREAGGKAMDLAGRDLDMPLDLEHRSSMLALGDPRLPSMIGICPPEGRRMVYGISANPKAANMMECTRMVDSALDGEQVLYDPGAAKALGKRATSLKDMDADVLVTIGGDGTVLRAAMVSNTPILGVNAGGVGFLTQIERDGIREGIARLKAGDYSVSRRLKLETRVGDERLEDSVNETVIHTDTIARIRRYRISVDGEVAMDVRADGIVVSTPTGSTGYALSLGAPLVDPNVDAMVIVPMAAYNFSSRPFVVPGDSKISIECVMDAGCMIVIDGQREHHVEGGTVVEIRRSESVSRIVSLGNDFYDRVHRKLVNRCGR